MAKPYCSNRDDDVSPGSELFSGNALFSEAFCSSEVLRCIWLGSSGSPISAELLDSRSSEQQAGRSQTLKFSASNHGKYRNEDSIQ